MTRPLRLAVLSLPVLALVVCSCSGAPSPSPTHDEPSRSIEMVRPSATSGITSPSIGFATPPNDVLAEMLDADSRVAWDSLTQGEGEVDPLLHALERDVASRGTEPPGELLLLLALAHVEDASGLTILGPADHHRESLDDDGPPSPAEIHERLERPAALLAQVIDSEPATSQIGALARIDLAGVLRLRTLLSPDHDVDDLGGLDLANQHLTAVAATGPIALADLARGQLDD